MDNICGGGWYFLYDYLQLKQVFRNMDLKAAFQVALNWTTIFLMQYFTSHGQALRSNLKREKK